MAYENQIKLNVNLTPLTDLKKQLDSTIKSLESDSNLKLNINVNEINTSFKEMSNIISALSSQLNKSFKLDTSGIDNVTNKLKNIQNLSSTNNTFKINSDGTTELVKSVDKINVGLGETITLTKDAQGQLTAMSNIDYTAKQKDIDEQYKLQQKDLEELNRLELKRQQELEKTQAKVKSIQETLQSKLNNSSSNNLINDSVLNNLQKELNSINVDTPISKIKELKTQINNLGSSDNSIVKLQNEINKMTNNLSALKGKYSNLVGNSNSKKELEDYINEINKLKSTLNDLKSGKSFTGNQLSQQFSSAKNASNELTNAVKNNASALKLAQKDASSFRDTIKHAFQSAGIFTTVYDGIRLVTEGFKNGISATIAMDTALGNLNKVVNLSKEQLSQMRDSAVEMGKELGRSSIEVANAQAEFGRLYKSQDEINEMTKVSLMGANVMDGVSADQVAKGLTTTISSMKMEAKDSITILDSMNEIQNNYRVGANDLLTALAEVGSTAYTSGSNLQQVEGYITAIAVATGKSGDEIGNSLKSIMSRVYKLGSEGLESEGKPEQMLNDMGVAVRDAEGNFRDFSAILSDLDIKWQRMSNTQKIATAQVVGGVNRYNDFMSLMNNYKMSLDSTTTALNSQGSATKENAIHMQTAAAKLGTLKATMQETAFKMVDSDMIKGTIDTINSLVETFGNLPSVIGLATTALLIFKGQAIMGAIQSIGVLIAGESAMTIATTGASLAWEKLSLSMSSNPLGVIALLFGGVALAINKAQKAQEELITSNKKAIESFESEKSSVTSANKLFEEKKKLEEQLSRTNEGTKENKDLKEKLLNVERQLAQALPNSISGYDEQGQAISKNNELIKAQIDLKNKQLEQDSLKQLKDNTTMFNDDIKSFKNMQQTLESYKKSREELLEKKSVADFSGNKIISTTTQNAINDYNKEITAMETSVSQRRLLILQLLECGKSYQEIANDIGESEGSVKGYTNSLIENSTEAENNKSSQDNLVNGVDNVGNSAVDTAKEFKALSDVFSGMSSQVDIIDQVIKEMKDYNGITRDTYGKLIQSHPQVLASLVKEGDVVSNLTQLREKDKRQMENIKEQAVELANEEYNTVLSNNSAEIKSNEEKNANKVNSDTGANNKVRQNSSDTVDTNGQNYTIDGKNFDGVSQSKITSDGGVGTAMTTNMSNTVNVLSGLYVTDYLNFEKITQAKQNLLGQLKDQLGNSASELIKNANTLDDVVGIRMADKMGLPNNGDITTDVGKSFGVQLEAYGNAFKKASDSIKTDIKSELPEMIKASPTMVGNPSSGSKGKSGKSDAEKEAEKALKEAVERDKKLLAEIADAYDDAKTKVSDSLKDIELNEQLLGKADNSNYVARVKLANERITEQSKALDSANQQLMTLENTSVETEDGQKGLADAIKKATTEIKTQKLEVVKLQQSLQDLVTNQIEQLLGKEKELKSLELEAKQDFQTKQLDEYTKAQEDAHNDRLEALNDEMEALEEQKDKESEEVKIAELKADIEQKKADLIEKQNDLKQKQIDLERVQNQKTVYTYQKDENGNWNFKWTADKNAIKSAQDNVDSAKKNVSDSKDSVSDSKKALSDYRDELEYNANKKAIQDKIDEENEKYKITEDFLKKKSESLQKQQEIEKKQLEHYYSDINKLSKDYLANLNQQYGDNWSLIAETINTNLTTIEDRFNKLTDLNVNYGLDTVAEALGSSNLDDYIIKRRQTVQEEVDVTTEALNKQLTDFVSYDADMLGKKQNHADNSLEIQKKYSDKTVEMQLLTNGTKINNELAYLEAQNEATEAMMTTLHMIYDEKWGDIVDVTTLSVEEILKQLEIMKEASDKYVEMWNLMHDEDEQIDAISIADVLSNFQNYKINSILEYNTDREALYANTSNSLNKLGVIDTSKLGSISSITSGLASPISNNTTNNTKGGDNYIMNGVVIQDNNLQKYMQNLANIGIQGAKNNK